MAETKFDLCGGHLAIDFANTVDERLEGRPVERLIRYEDLVEFGRQSSILTEEAAARLIREAQSRPMDAQNTLRDAVALREALYRIFGTTTAGDKPPSQDMMVLNAQLARLRLNDEYEWEWSSLYGGLDQLLGPIVRAAVDLLTTGPRERVSTCHADDCAWLFLDSSKNHSRKWCDMGQCGNRAKVRRYHARHRVSSYPET